MTARTHDLAAITALGIVVLSVPPQTVTLGTALLAILANQIGGIAPDLDQPTAPFWRNLPIGKIFGKFAGKLLGGHRFITHSLLGVFIVGFLVNLLLNFVHPLMPNVNIQIVWWAFIIGMLSHLVMDTFTKEGVPWLLPIPIKIGIPPIRAWRVTTGKFSEKIVFLAVLAFAIWFCLVNYQEIRELIHKYIV
jgi:inner membrane protein